ncbi:MAG: PAS domain-containing sensor histidine kinase [bacterium]|nr:PAS domain-containing sensor histidine kinase [bacterium]
MRPGRTPWPWASLVALATTATAWPAAGYGALVIWAAGDLPGTGTLWIFGWPFVVQLLLATVLHLLAVGAGARLGVPPLFPALRALDEAVARRDDLARLDALMLRTALHAATRFPVWDMGVGLVLSLCVVATSALLEWHVAGPESPNVWVIVRGGCYATLLYVTASLALGELLTRPVCRDLRRAAAAAGLACYDGFVIGSGWRIGLTVVPTLTALLVAMEIGLAVEDGAPAFLALVALSGLVALGLSWLQAENERRAVRELSAACHELAAGRDAVLVTGSIASLPLEMAHEFTAAARRVGDDRRASGARYRALFESALDGIVTMDERGRILEFNPAAERTFERAHAALIGTATIDDLLPPALQPPEQIAVSEALATADPGVLDHRVELIAAREDGATFPVELAVTRIRVDGPPVFTGFLRDITERKRAEAALSTSQRLAEEEAEIAAALLHVGQALGAHLDAPDVLERVNRLAVEVLACDWSSTYMWDERRQSFRLRANVGSPPEIVAEIEQVEFTADTFPLVTAVRRGTLVELAGAEAEALAPAWLLRRWNVGPMLAAPLVRRGEVVGMLLSGYRGRRPGRFTRRQHRLALGTAQAAAVALENVRLIADLQAASRVKSEFLSTMSHELRTPLNVVLGYVEMARDERLADIDRRSALGRVEGAGRDLLQLIESTLEIGRIEAGRDDVRVATLDLAVFWRELGAACARLPRHEGVLLHWRPAPDGAELTSDPRKLTVVVRNLVGNALKFTATGSVSASLTLDGDRVVLRVADTGIGIRPEDQEVVFEMFRQADGSDTRQHGGTGLGLYLVRRFVSQLGGTVALESEPGRGAIFTVTLPRALPIVGLRASA